MERARGTPYLHTHITHAGVHSLAEPIHISRGQQTDRISTGRIGRPRFTVAAPHTRPPRRAALMREGGRKRAERHTHCAHHSLLRCVYARVRTRRDATVLLVTRARHTDAHRTGLRARKLHPAESDREKYKECERTETERATNDEMERKGR